MVVGKGRLIWPLQLPPCDSKASPCSLKQGRSAPVLAALYTHFGPAARCSAGFQPAVSQGFQPAGLSNLPTRPEPPPALPIGNRRYSRLETCATSSHEMRVGCSGDGRTPPPITEVLSPVQILTWRWILHRKHLCPSASSSSVNPA